MRRMFLFGLMLIVGVAYAAGISVSVDKPELYQTTLQYEASDQISVWADYVTVTVTKNGSGLHGAYVKAMSRGDEISTAQPTNSSGVAVLPLLTSSPPPIIEIWVKDPETGEWVNPEPVPPIVDPWKSGAQILAPQPLEKEKKDVKEKVQAPKEQSGRKSAEQPRSTSAQPNEFGTGAQITSEKESSIDELKIVLPIVLVLILLLLTSFIRNLRRRF